MRQSATIVHCDVCKEHQLCSSGGGYEEDRLPVGWIKVVISSSSSEPRRNRTIEACRSCADRIIAALEGKER